MNVRTDPANQAARQWVKDERMDAPIVVEAEPITADSIRKFAEATLSVHATACPATFPTVFRSAEFKWLSVLGIDMRNLLHTDQEYEYFSDWKVGDLPVITTAMEEFRERRGLLFVSLETVITCSGEKRVRACSSFVVRKGATKEGGEDVGRG